MASLSFFYQDFFSLSPSYLRKYSWKWAIWRKNTSNSLVKSGRKREQAKCMPRWCSIEYNNWVFHCLHLSISKMLRETQIEIYSSKTPTNICSFGTSTIFPLTLVSATGKTYLITSAKLMASSIPGTEFIISCMKAPSCPNYRRWEDGGLAPFEFQRNILCKSTKLTLEKKSESSCSREGSISLHWCKR